ncbi:MAG: nucleoside deaminase [Leptolyngbya sp. SIO4C5]|nr:nucleoside deaminase [Leptolyngbya sp. SIO4C5]
MPQPNPEFMQAAIALSLESIRHGDGGPYGAVVVKEGKIIGRGMNQVAPLKDPTAHAEMLAIRQACQQLQHWQLQGCELYTSCEPCPMCMATIYWAKLDRVYYANSKEDASDYGFNSGTIYEQIALPISERSLPMSQLMQDKAVAAFKEWANKTDKLTY